MVFAAALGAATLAGCAATSTETSPSPPSGSSNGHVPAGQSTQLEMDMHASATWADAGLTVTLTGVPNDSRCPTGTNCVWAGNASVELAAAVDSRNETFSLRFGPPGGDGDLLPDRVDRLGFRFEIVRLEPTPTAGRTTDALSYRATVRVTAL